MRRLRILSAIVGLIAIAWGPAYAQSVGATTGAINGKVSDATGGVMPGVTVTIASPSMQGVRTAVTDAEGLVPLSGDSSRRIQDHLRARRVLDGEPRGHPRRPRIHGDREHRADAWRR